MPTKRKREHNDDDLFQQAQTKLARLCEEMRAELGKRTTCTGDCDQICKELNTLKTQNQTQAQTIEDLQYQNSYLLTGVIPELRDDRLKLQDETRILKRRYNVLNEYLITKLEENINRRQTRTRHICTA